ncbi:MAG: hypothetical protein ACREPI_08070, partial [Candidatus Dormibacterales bacterium]
AGVAALGARHYGLAVEGVFLAVAAVQLAVGALRGAGWLFVNRRRVGAFFRRQEAPLPFPTVITGQGPDRPARTKRRSA